MVRTHPMLGYNNNNNSDFLCTNILEDLAQWRDKTKGLSNLVIVKPCVSRQWMDEGAWTLRMIGGITERFLYTDETKLYFHII